MLKSAALAAVGAAALWAPIPARATATVDIQTLWAVYLDGMTDAAGGFTRGAPGITVSMSGDASYNGAWWGNILSLNQSVDNGSQSFDLAATGSLEISNSDPANAGKMLNVRQDVSAANLLLLGVTYPGLESAAAMANVTASRQESDVQCATGNNAGACGCTPSGCGLSDYYEITFGLAIPGVGDLTRIDYAATVHADLTGDPPSVPEPSFPWGLPMLLGTIMLPYVGFWRRLR